MTALPHYHGQLPNTYFGTYLPTSETRLGAVREFNLVMG
jgi:hypothetical protein